ncbi:MAG: MBL fold metallo-hydrolase [Acidobacteriia bacterium]|nr:MBL fold metallo-hydrolase [Terriglobia bacterium]
MITPSQDDRRPRVLPKILCLVAVALPCVVQAQAPGAVPAKPDSEKVKALIEKARKTGEPMWSEEAHFFCEAPRPNSPSDPPIEPTRIFDNVSVIGNQGTVAYVIGTSDGLLMIDSLAANQVDSQLLPGFQKLGLNPANVKVIVMGHGHADHFGGSAYMQEHYGSKVYISAADWDLMGHPPAGRAGQKKASAPLPKHDQVVVAGEPIVLGDFRMTPIAIPGHTPGSMGYIFSVKDRGKTRVAALYGGTILTPGIVSDQGLRTYRKSVAHFKQETRKAKVEVELQNHPLMDPIQIKLDRLKARKEGEPNPFVVGAANYQKFVDVMAACTDVNMARRE